jgi:iron-sulfur cluster insertion protein
MKGGGCHGYQYGMSLESTMGEDDTVVEHGVASWIRRAPRLLVDTEVDYVDSMQRSGFVMKNPHVKTTCGCGSSFSV